MDSKSQVTGNKIKIRAKVSLKGKMVPYIFILPFLLSFIIFFAAPAVYSFVLSFFAYKGYGNARFTGFNNYLSLLNYNTFWLSIRNTFFYFIVHTIPVMVFAFLFAVAMHSKLLSAAQAIYKPILFLPQVVPIIASSLVWRIMLATQYGVVNQLFGTKIPFLENPRNMKWAVVALIVWRATGWYMVIYLAGLTTISDEIDDATRIDGASALQKILYVTIPMMKPIFLFAFIIDAIGSFKLFTEPNVLIFSNGGVITEPEAIPIMNVLVQNINGASFGMASATGWLLFIIILIISLIQFKFFSSKEG